MTEAIKVHPLSGRSACYECVCKHLGAAAATLGEVPLRGNAESIYAANSRFRTEVPGNELQQSVGGGALRHTTPLIMLRRVQAVMAEVATGDFKHHIHYACGYLVLLETALNNVGRPELMCEVRDQRKNLLMSRDITKIDIESLAESTACLVDFELDRATAFAHMEEAAQECPIPEISSYIRAFLAGNTNLTPNIDEWLLMLDVEFLKEVKDAAVSK